MAGRSLCAHNVAASYNHQNKSSLGEGKNTSFSFSIDNILGLEREKDGTPAAKPHRPWVDKCSDLGKMDVKIHFNMFFTFFTLFLRLKL